jgi:hypothetical protein
MKGFILTVIIEDSLFMLEFFKCLRIGISWSNDLVGKAKVLILGVWKLEANIALILRNKLEWHDFGKETGQT